MRRPGCSDGTVLPQLVTRPSKWSVITVYRYVLSSVHATFGNISGICGTTDTVVSLHANLITTMVTKTLMSRRMTKQTK